MINCLAHFDSLLFKNVGTPWVGLHAECTNELFLKDAPLFLLTLVHLNMLTRLDRIKQLQIITHTTGLPCHLNCLSVKISNYLPFSTITSSFMSKWLYDFLWPFLTSGQLIWLPSLESCQFRHFQINYY